MLAQIRNVCGNKVCDSQETSKTCSLDCSGPADEFGASILVTQYTEDFTFCDKSRTCSSGYRRAYRGQMMLRNVEMKYYGKKANTPGISVVDLGEMGKDEGVTIDNVAMNRGYNQAVSIEKSNNVSMSNCVIYRSMLPAVKVGIGARWNSLTSNLAVISIYQKTHRGSVKEVCVCM
jgi:hypothetical protein